MKRTILVFAVKYEQTKNQNKILTERIRQYSIPIIFLTANELAFVRQKHVCDCSALLQNKYINCIFQLL